MMSEAADAWRELQRRAHESKFSGVSSNTDDLMADADIRENLINPNAGGGGGQQAGGGMMPPMMMGGMGAGGGAQQQAGGLGGGSGAAQGVSAAGGSAGGYSPAAAAAAPSAPTVQAAGGEEMPEPGGGIPSAGGLSGGGPSGGGIPEGEMPGGEGAPEEEVAEEEPGGDAQIELNEQPGQMELNDSVENPDGFTVEEQELQEIAQLWEELSDTIGIGSREMPGAGSLGFAEDLRPTSDELAGFTQRWAMQAAKEFLGISHQLISAKRAYDDIEAESFRIASSQEA